MTAPHSQPDIAQAMDDIDAEYYAGGLREIADHSDTDPETEMYLKAAAVFIERQQKVIATLSLSRPDEDNSPRCNHWPGQHRCGVCGMDEPPYTRPNHGDAS